MITDDGGRIIALERMIECIQDNKDGFGLIVSVEVAQTLYNYVYDIMGGDLKLAIKGDEFTYKGVRCIVA